LFAVNIAVCKLDGVVAGRWPHLSALDGIRAILMRQQAPHSPATRADIATIVRTSDTDLIARIAATQVSYTELVEAFLRVAGEFQTDTDELGPGTRVVRAMTILTERRGTGDCPDE
jgi:hypothetical protein